MIMASILILKKIIHLGSRNKKYADTGYSYVAMSLHFANGDQRKFIHNSCDYRDAIRSAKDYQKYTDLPLSFETQEIFD